MISSGDLQLNPGPRSTRITKFPCGVCQKACTKNQYAVACDSCDVWYHTKCMAMNSGCYRALSNISWHCCACGLPNFNSSLFLDWNNNASVQNSCVNPFNTLNLSNSNYSHSPLNTSNSSPRPVSTPNHKKKPTPILTSTPNPAKNTKTKNLKSDLSLLIINFQSFFNKRSEISHIAEETKADIIIGTETWLTPGPEGAQNSELLLDEYDIYRRDRPTRGGGVMIAVKKCLFSTEISNQESEIIFCKIELEGNKTLIVSSVYRPPSYSEQESHVMAGEVHDIFAKHPNSVYWLGGDLNLPDIDWEKHEIEGHQYLKDINQTFLDLAQDLGLDQMVDFPTRGGNILDVFMTNRPGLVKKCNLIPGVSDHEIVHIVSSVHPVRKKPTKHDILLWNKVDVSKMTKEAQDFNTKFLNQFSTNDSVEDMWSFIKTEVNKIIKSNVPSKTTSSKFHQPWINTITKRLLRRKNRWFKKMKQTKSTKVRKIYNKVKAECQKTCRQALNSYLNDLFTNDTTNKKLWTYIKSKRQENVGIGDIKNSKNIPTRDPVKRAEIIHDQFDSVFSKPNPKINHIFDDGERLPDMNSIVVNRQGLLKLLLNINIHKATGPDNIPGRFLKLCANEIVDVYVLLFQASLKQGTVPQDWREASVTPLFKKGDRLKAENYRPISLTSVSSKLLEHIIHSNIMSHFDNYSVLNNSQHGFRKRRSCTSQLITTLDDFASCLQQKGELDAVLLDFSKAFDKVDHEGLLLKLEHLGIRHSMLMWIRSFLIGRNQKVLVDGKCSAPRSVESGVPQGTVLGPLLFLVYINDISSGLSEGTKISLFADDSLLYRTIKSEKDCEILQRDLDLLQTWEIKWKMEFHPGKCQLLKVTNKINKTPYNYTIHGQTILETNAAKYLGVTIDCKLNWKNHYTEINRKANYVLSLLRRNLSNCPMDIKAKCYNTLVRPICEYACEVWDPHYQDDIDYLEKIQKRGARFATGNYVMEEGNTKKNLDLLGWETLEDRRTKTKLITFQKIRLNNLEVPHEHLSLKDRNSRHDCDGPNYFRSYSSIDGHINSFFPTAVRVWNRLPAEAKTCNDMEHFKNTVKSNLDIAGMKKEAFATCYTLRNVTNI